MGYRGKSSEPKLVCQNPKCEKLGRYQPQTNFYKANNSTTPFYPFCKKCVDTNIDVNNLQEVQDFLKELDKPFIMDIWKEVCANNTNKFIEKYMKEISKVKYQNLKWEDSILEETDTKVEIKENSAYNDIPEWNEEWQGEYTKKDIEYLNNYIGGLKKDFDISTINHMDYAKEIAKTSLLKSKAYAIMLKEPTDDNIKSYKNLVSMFDNLSKSAQFAESQRGANDVGLGSFGQIFDAVEKHNWVPTYVPEDKDMYDKLLDQFANIEKSL